MRAVLFGIWWLMMAGACLGQGNIHYTLRNYSPSNGLPQSQVQAIVEDNNGYLWIGTEAGGLTRFDGREFKIYTTLNGLLGNNITGLHIDGKENLWILHPKGLTKFDGIKFTRFPAPGTREKSSNFRRIKVVNDTILVLSTSGKISKIYEDSVYYWDRYRVSDIPVIALHNANDGKLISLYKNGRIEVSSEKEKYFLADSVRLSESYGRVNIFNHGDEVWVAVNGKAYTINFEERRLDQLPIQFRHWVLFYDHNDNVFWTYSRSTLFKETLQQSEWQQPDTVIKNIDVYQVLPDSEGNYWIASNGRGLFKYFAQDFINFGGEKLGVVMAILEDREGDLWVGSMTSGLWKISDGKLASYNNSSMYQFSVADLFEAPDKTVWAATSQGLGRYDRRADKFRWYTQKDGLTSDRVLNVAFYDNKMWVGTQRGLNVFDGTNFHAFSSNDGLSSDLICSMHYSKYHNTLFVGTEFGVDMVKDGKISKINIPGIESTMVCTINSYRDSLLLIGVGSLGIMVYDPSTGKTKTITTRDGLASDFIYFAVSDADNVLWIGSEKGITRMRLNEKLEVIENLHYDDLNGLTGLETNQNAFHFNNGKKYFGLIDGLYKYNHIDRKDKKSFGLHLTNVELFYGEDSPQHYSDSLVGFFKMPYKPLLPPDKNHITFHFNRVDKLYPKSVKFKYYLENFDHTWSLPSSVNRTTYSNLPPGDYVFRVMATDDQGSWTDNIAYPFTVLSPFYKRPSFIAGMVILLAGTVTLTIYLRLRQRVTKAIEMERIRMQAQENVRKEIARDFHDEMGNQLTRIINYISLMKMNGRNGNGHIDLYSKVEESAKYLYTGTRDFIWSIDPGNDELTRLFIHIRDFGEKLFEEKNINFRAYDEVKEYVKLPLGFSREANLIFKEAMTNSFKYSEAKNANLILRQAVEGFEISFEDDGVGFSMEESEATNGIKNITERAERINAALHIHSVKNNGTRIRLNFRLTKTGIYGTTV